MHACYCQPSDIDLASSHHHAGMMIIQKDQRARTSATSALSSHRALSQQREQEGDHQKDGANFAFELVDCVQNEMFPQRLITSGCLLEQRGSGMTQIFGRCRLQVDHAAVMVCLALIKTEGHYTL